MKKMFLLVPLWILALLALAGCGQTAERLNNQGNEAFASQDYEGALAAYHQAQESAPELAEPRYNAASGHYRLEDYEQAQQQIEQALVSEENSETLDRHSFYNLGNTFFQIGEFEAAVEAYKEALRLDPGDLEAKQNLELALRQLQQQQQEQQQEQQPDQQDQDQQDEQNQDQQEGQDDQQQEGQEQQSQDEQNQDQQQGENKQQQSDQQQQNQDDGDGQERQQEEQHDEGQPQNEPQQDPPDSNEGGRPSDPQQNGQAGGQPQQLAGLSEEQARRLFEAAAQGTESLEEFLQQILVFPGAPPTEDW